MKDFSAFLDLARSLRVYFILSFFILYTQIPATGSREHTEFETISVRDIQHIAKNSCILAGLSHSQSLNDNVLNVFKKLQIAFKDEPRVRIARLTDNKDALESVKWNEDFKENLSNSFVVFFPKLKPDRVCLTPKPKFVPSGEVSPAITVLNCQLLLYGCLHSNC